MFLKYCGFTRKDDVDFAASLSIDAVGLIFYKKSKRYITAEAAAEITKDLPKNILKVGVFVGEDVETMNKIAEIAALDRFQIFADELDKVKMLNQPVLPAYRIAAKSDLENIFFNDLLLLDAFSQFGAGGTGESFQWSFLKNFKAIDRTIIAGGVTADNLSELLTIATPYGIDLSSGIENAPGIKSHSKMQQFKDNFERIINEQT